jgi:3-oxoacyl-[acyl-carrier-protein] synthase II
MAMNPTDTVFVTGIGAVSPAGWGMASFREALTRGEPIPTKELPRPGWSKPLRVRQVPAPDPRPQFLAHARLRRTSPVAHYLVGAALEAVAAETRREDKSFRLGIVVCALTGCVNYSRRFYGEVLRDPATASPLVFPETVYNSAASHLASLLGTTAINYTLVGDPGTFLQAIALGADWLISRRVDGCLVAGAEEMDWLTADALRLFDRKTTLSEGAGALYLKLNPEKKTAVRLQTITDPQLFCGDTARSEAAKRAREGLREMPPGSVLCDGLSGSARTDRAEANAWRDWTGPRLSPKSILGEGLMAGAAWQCVAAVDALQENRYDAATVSVVGCNQQAIAAQFVRA